MTKSLKKAIMTSPWLKKNLMKRELKLIGADAKSRKFFDSAT